MPAPIWAPLAIAATSATLLSLAGCSFDSDEAARPTTGATPASQPLTDALSALRVDGERLLLSDAPPKTEQSEGAIEVNSEKCRTAISPQIEPEYDNADHLAVATSENGHYTVSVIRNNKNSLDRNIRSISDAVNECSTLKINDGEKNHKYSVEVAETDSADVGWSIRQDSQPSYAFAVKVTKYGAIVASSNYVATGKHVDLVDPLKIIQETETALKESEVPPIT